MMKKLLRITAFIAGLAMIICAFPFSIISAGAAESNAITFLKGDYNKDCVIDSKDLDYIYGIIKGTVTAPAANTDEYNRLNIVKDSDGFTMEDVRRVARVAKGVANNESLFTDTTEKNQYYLEFFNSLANVIKTKEFIDANRVSYFMKSTNSTETKNFNFNFSGINVGPNAAENIKNMYDEEMAGVNIEYTALREDVRIHDSNLPSFGHDYISALSTADVQSVTLASNTVCDILTDDEFSDNLYTRKANSAEYDVTRFNKEIKGALKVTVVLKQENKASVEKLPSAANGGETILMRGYGNDVRDILAEFPHEEKDEVENLLTMTMKMKCSNLTSDCTIEYYFKPDTLEPIAARYLTRIVSYQSVDILVETGLGDIKGSFDPTSISVYEHFYFFNNSYPQVG